MPIGKAVQRDDVVYVYDERGSLLFSLVANKGRTGGLQSYTSTAVSVKRGDAIVTYNAQARLITPPLFE